LATISLRISVVRRDESLQYPTSRTIRWRDKSWTNNESVREIDRNKEGRITATIQFLTTTWFSKRQTEPWEWRRLVRRRSAVRADRRLSLNENSWSSFPEIRLDSSTFDTPGQW
jgi:hypothetical protein